MSPSIVEMISTILIYFEVLISISITLSFEKIAYIYIYIFVLITFFFWIQGNPALRKAYFVGPGERVKSRLFQTLTRGARPDSNSRPTVQISSSLPSRYAPWGLDFDYLHS